jgi:hypothetical protein
MLKRCERAWQGTQQSMEGRPAFGYASEGGYDDTATRAATVESGSGQPED